MSLMLFAGLLAGAPPAYAGGGLDPGFGTGGKVTTDFAGRFDEGRGAVLQPDGRIVVAGEATRSVNGVDDRDFGVARYKADGSLDRTFNGTGTATTHFGMDFELAFAVALQPDGKVVSAGVSGDFDEETGSRFALARYNADGTADTSFGHRGRVTTTFPGTSAGNAFAVAVQGDGRIVVAGFATKSSGAQDEDFALARYNADGSLDTTFGGTGLVITDFDGEGDDAFGVAIQGDGKIVVVGGATKGGNGDFALARYNTNGSLDATFGDHGLVRTDFGGGARRSDEGDAIVLLRDGRILVSGAARVSEHGDDFTGGEFGLARYDADGRLDATFGGHGLVRTDFDPGLNDQAFALTVQPDGKIVAAGHVSLRMPTDKVPAPGDLGLARYTADGALDPTFGLGGRIRTDFNGGFDGAFGVLVQADGKIVAVGEESPGREGDRDVALVIPRLNRHGRCNVSVVDLHPLRRGFR